MFGVEIENVDYQTGKRSVRMLPNRYKTRQGAERKAMQVACVVRPAGGSATSEVFARVQVCKY